MSAKKSISSPKRSKSNKIKPAKRGGFSRVQMLIFILVFALIGGSYYLIKSHAATLTNKPSETAKWYRTPVAYGGLWYQSPDGSINNPAAVVVYPTSRANPAIPPVIDGYERLNPANFNKAHWWNLNGIYYQTTTAGNNSINLATYMTVPAQSKVTPGLVYVVGDSIGTQFAPGLAAALNATGGGWSVRANVISGRSLSSTTPSSGMGAVDADQAFVKESKAIVVELGTNTSGLTVANIDTMINKIRSYNPNAVIFWVNTAVVNRPTYVAGLNNVNRYIAGEATAKGYKVIDWNRKVFGAGADPTNMAGGVDNNHYINVSDVYHVHLTPAGVAAYTNLVVANLKK